MLLGQPIRQIAYYVEDVREAARRHSALFGSGPFFIMNLPPLDVVYRGNRIAYDQTGAVGQWGKVQVELLQENGDGPSILHELYPKGSGRTGIHHVAMFVDDVEDAVARCKKAGFDEAMRVKPQGTDITAVFIDAVATHGHFLELYEPKPPLLGLYDMVEKAAVGFVRSDSARSVPF